jgi:serine/threonine-protein kinase
MPAARSYRIAELLGRGSFGVVYLADTVGTGIGRRVAIKVLRPEHAAWPGLLERLRDEARMLSMIRHRAIVGVDDLVELDGRWSVVMEYIEGCDVAALLADGPLPPRVALAIAEEIANALHVAATQEGPDGRPLRLVHRDVKPGNIRVTAQGEVKLLDFGVARADFATREASPTTVVYGTPTYMAPERFRGDDTHAGDVYALGVTLFEMLAGEPPGQGPMELERVPPGIQLAGAWRSLRDTSLPLRDLVCAMLAHAPEERPPARECARALARIRAQLGGMTLEDWAERVVPPALKRRGRPADERVGTVLLERPSQATLRPRRSGAGRSMVLAAGTVALLVVAGGLGLAATGAGAWWMWGRGGEVGRAVEGGTASTSPAAAAETPPSPAPAPPPTPQTDPATPAETPARPAPEPPRSAAPTSPPAGSATASRTTTSTTAAPASNATAPRSSSTSGSRAASPPASTASSHASSTGAAAGGVTGPSRGLPTTGIVVLDGQAVALMLTGRAGVFATGEVPVGDYLAEATLSSGDTFVLRAFTVNPGRVTRLDCGATSCREVEEW